ncbi:Na+/H+ antiporter subunit E [Magnetovibrio blakemorei]|uniref:Cation:proton antiporter n=1 Tax=Magnetovibrio blakemorei TaxID=28181 RepID=A0A1E5Q510_9PROT|nr:Na+/H+ antiporter subunit E [Magnetovibrio blakemorei]OEJ65319.1 hypothetical protein BEN30_14455 [Magnetovibrio blakemorei]
MNSEVLSSTRQSVELFVTLFMFWVLLNGSLAPDTLAIGCVAAFVIAVLFRDGLSFLFEFRILPSSLWASVQYFVYFMKELIVANVRLAIIVLSPSLPIKPGIVKVRTRLKSRMGRLLLANSITLTPGTLTVELEDDWLYIHWVTVEAVDMEDATTLIVAGFERYLERMYG